MLAPVTGVKPAYTQNVQNIRANTLKAARFSGFGVAKPEHLLVALVENPCGFGGAILRDHMRAMGVSAKELKGKILTEPTESEKYNGNVVFSDRLTEIFKLAQKIARVDVGSGELLQALAENYRVKGVIDWIVHFFAKLFGGGKINSLELQPNIIRREIDSRSQSPKNVPPSKLQAPVAKNAERKTALPPTPVRGLVNVGGTFVGQL